MVRAVSHAAQISGQRRFGILAGGGQLPIEIADSLRARGATVSFVAMEGEANADFSNYPVTWVRWGQVGAIVSAFRKAECTDILIVGGVRRPDLLRLKPDLGFFTALLSVLRVVRAGGDDSVLRGVLSFFEQNGFNVVGPADVAPDLLIGKGSLGQNAPEPDAMSVIQKGFAVLAALSPYDVGQAVVISEDLRIEAIEGIEGTDGMLARVARLRQARGNISAKGQGYFIKAPKRGQELRIDLPVIGPDTALRAVEANLAGLAVEAGRVLAAEKKRLVTTADTQGLAIVGAMSATPADPNPSRRKNESLNPASFSVMGRHSMTPKFTEDATLGLQLLRSLQAFDEVGGVGVARGHILGVETGEGVSELCTRLTRHKQWGLSRLGRRRGAFVIRMKDEFDDKLAAQIAEAGFAGIVILSDGNSKPAAEIVQAFDEAGMSIASLPFDQLALHERDQDV